MKSDLINSLLLVIGGGLNFTNCWVIYRDKCVRGVSIYPVAFFALWALWDLYYYPHLGQWISFLGGLVIATANTLWCGLALYYRGRDVILLDHPSPSDDAESIPGTYYPPTD